MLLYIGLNLGWRYIYIYISYKIIVAALIQIK